MDTKGGRFTLEIANVGGSSLSFSGRGVAKIMPSQVSLDAQANQDSTGYVTVKPELAKLELTFDRGVGLIWNAAMLLSPVNVTFTETDVGLQHLYTGASWVGEPSIDSATGEVSGVSLRSDQYSALAVG